MDAPPDLRFDSHTLYAASEILRLGLANARPLPEILAQMRGNLLGREPQRRGEDAEAAIRHLLRQADVWTPEMLAIEYEHPKTGSAYLEADELELVHAVSYALGFDDRGRKRQTGHQATTHIAAEAVVRHLQLCGYLVMRPRRAGNAPGPLYRDGWPRVSGNTVWPPTPGQNEAAPPPRSHGDDKE